MGKSGAFAPEKSQGESCVDSQNDFDNHRKDQNRPVRRGRASEPWKSPTDDSSLETWQILKWGQCFSNSL